LAAYLAQGEQSPKNSPDNNLKNKNRNIFGKTPQTHHNIFVYGYRPSKKQHRQNIQKF
jgi:hypothetical protein